MSIIKLGNDDFILFIRKNQRKGGIAFNTKNNQLGSEIWHYIRDNKIGDKVSEESIPCKWNPIECNDDGYGLPRTATQFYIDDTRLSELYKKLFEISQI